MIDKDTIEREKERLLATFSDTNDLLDEIIRLKIGLWDCATISGVDTDGNEHPFHMTYSDIVEYATRAVTDLRNDYNILLIE